MFLKTSPVYIALVFILSTLACTTTVTTISDIGLNDNEYDQDFFQVESNNKIDRVINSVKMINCMAYYQSYLFNIESNITIENIGDKDLASLAVMKNFSTETSSGTASVIYSEKGKVALLTCAHILDFPDTLITYFEDGSGAGSQIIESVSIKSRQTNILPELTVSNSVKILALDKESDIAIVGGEFPSLVAYNLIPLDIKFGTTEDLSWGIKVFIIGYPLNNKMITTGIASPNQVKGKDYFFVDAVFNRGFSGGIVLAVRDGAPNFELLGMIKSGTVHRRFNLVPDSNNPDFTYLPGTPYNEDILVQEETEIKYGVTRVMSVETIYEFFDFYKEKLNGLGYTIKYSL